MSAQLGIGARLAATSGAFGAVARNPALRRVELAYLGFALTEWGIWIALPRTASVTAVTPVDLLALDRHHFVETVTGQPLAAEAAEAVIHAHLDHATDDRSATDAGS